MATQKKIITVTQTAQLLQCSRQNVLYLLAKGRIAGTLIGGTINRGVWVVDAASAERYLARRDAKQEST